MEATAIIKPISTVIERSSPSISNVNTDVQLIMLWLEGKSQTTQRMYTCSVKHFFDWVGKPLASVRLEDLIEYHSILRKKYLSLYTISNKIQPIKSLLTYGHKVGYLKVNVGGLINPQKPLDCREERRISSNDAKKLIEVGKTPMEKAVITIGYYLGLRVGELVALQWFDLIKVDNQIKLRVIGKGHKKRVLPVPGTVLAVLEQLGDSTGTIIKNYKGAPMSTVGIHKLVKRLAKRANLNPNISYHWLRHCHASTALANGCPIALLSKNLGHSSIDTTMKYLHFGDKDASPNYVN